MRSELTRLQLSPPSLERNRPPSSASISAYTLRLSEAATPTPTLPQIPFGRPFFKNLSAGFNPSFADFASFSESQVSPPSCETYRPLPGPPLVSSQGRRRVCQVPAKRMRGLLGSKHTSLAPVFSSTNNTFSQFLPPSLVR